MLHFREQGGDGLLYRSGSVAAWRREEAGRSDVAGDISRITRPADAAAARRSAWPSVSKASASQVGSKLGWQRNAVNDGGVVVARIELQFDDVPRRIWERVRRRAVHGSEHAEAERVLQPSARTRVA